MLFPLTARVFAAAEYIVKPGDSLSRIAATQLGSEARWTEIANANQLKPPYQLRPGQRLTIPSQPATTRPPNATPAPTRPAPVSVAAPAAPTVAPKGTTVSGPLVQPPGSPQADATAWRDVVGNLAPTVKELAPWILLLLALAWFFHAVCLRGACWFALVETNLRQCFLMALMMILLVLLASGIGFLLTMSMFPPLNLPWQAMAIAGVLLAVGVSVGSILVVKRTLDCHWRSVVTIFVMTHFVANSLMLLTVVAITLVPAVDMSMQQLAQSKLTHWAVSKRADASANR
ncbi:MAG: LysM domain-containing protein [Verrucomicrobiota bacterium]